MMKNSIEKYLLISKYLEKSPLIIWKNYFKVGIRQKFALFNRWGVFEIRTIAVFQHPRGLLGGATLQNVTHLPLHLRCILTNQISFPFQIGQ